MRHQWVIDILLDLQSYAEVNDLPQTAGRVEELLAVARLEIRGSGATGDADEPDPSGFQACGRAH
ncbi:MAG: hypothetical protein B7Y02_06015 [Rhodobacterales bacterium 17-64-5]|nr:MAG: hypothetical protein B7Z31_08165 [Rhodobacterales bacterium 12-65-15]OYX89608.1 MAG: hypothetical protein B7Y84_04410 [Azorhizobium sp. 32-67-21]OZA13455.1 MAG: hypothetical protein B7Y02_06015 [Rhodobacterales bacterium 17-64-5]